MGGRKTGFKMWISDFDHKSIVSNLFTLILLKFQKVNKKLLNIFGYSLYMEKLGTDLKDIYD